MQLLEFAQAGNLPALHVESVSSRFQPFRGSTPLQADGDRHTPSELLGADFPPNEPHKRVRLRHDFLSHAAAEITPIIESQFTALNGIESRQTRQPLQLKEAII